MERKLFHQLPRARAVEENGGAISPRPHPQHCAGGSCALYPSGFTARLLDEIAGARDPARLTTLCVLLLSISTLTLLLAAACKHWCTAEEETNSYREAQQFFTKLLQMDFCAVDDAKTHDLLSQIRQNETWSGWGLPRVPEEYQTLLRGLIKIVCSAALSVSLF